jgi:hypothetical protein
MRIISGNKFIQSSMLNDAPRQLIGLRVFITHAPLAATIKG